MYIVLVLRGKGCDSPDFARVKLFKKLEDAEMYCNENNDRFSKYWTCCEIVKDDEEIEVYHENY